MHVQDRLSERHGKLPSMSITQSWRGVSFPLLCQAQNATLTRLFAWPDTDFRLFSTKVWCSPSSYLCSFVQRSALRKHTGRQIYLRQWAKRLPAVWSVPTSPFWPWRNIEFDDRNAFTYCLKALLNFCHDLQCQTTHLNVWLNSMVQNWKGANWKVQDWKALEIFRALCILSYFLLVFQSTVAYLKGSHSVNRLLCNIC